MGRIENARLGPGDVVAVALAPGDAWIDLVQEVWDAGAALFPVDVRIPSAEIDNLLRRARPTVLLGPRGWERRMGGLPARDDVALVVHTSGTAGAIKLAEFRRAAIEAAVSSSALALEASPADRWLCCLPVAHVGGLLVLLRGVLLGAPVSVHPSFDPAAVAAEPGVAFVSVVPTMLGRLLDAGVDLTRYRAILVGGARLPAELRMQAEAAGGRVVETYGLTESCGGVVYEGRPLRGVEVRIDAGEIALRGPTLMTRYRSDPAGTRRVLSAEGWLRPGDAGVIDVDGRLRVLGRVDDLIDSGGEKVWPAEVEDVLRSHPKVAEIAVSGRPDPEWGERVVAFVIPRDPADPPTLDDLRATAARRLPRHKAPRELVLVSELPRTSSGKVRRWALHDQE